MATWKKLVVEDSSGHISQTAASADVLATSRNINGVGFDGSANITIYDSTKQPLDGDLTSIADISATSGFLKKISSENWQLDTNTYLTALPDSGVTAGTYNDATTIYPLTISSKGVVTSVGTATTIAPTFYSITSKPTTLSGYGITDAISTSGGTITGDLVLSGTGSDLTVGGSVTITGDLTVNGDTVQVNVGTITIEDNTLHLASEVASTALSAGSGLLLSNDDTNKPSLLWKYNSGNGGGAGWKMKTAGSANEYALTGMYYSTSAAPTSANTEGNLGTIWCHQAAGSGEATFYLRTL